MINSGLNEIIEIILFEFTLGNIHVCLSGSGT